VIELFKGNIFNVHGSRLPRDRGGGGFSWRLMQGNYYGFALIHQLDAGLDTGGIVKVKEFLYEGKRTPQAFDSATIEESLILLQELIEDCFSSKELKCASQPEYLSSYWPRLKTDIHGAIDWSWTGEEIARFISAFDEPYPGAFTLLNGKRVHVKSAVFDAQDGVFHPFQSGIIYRISESYAAIATRTGSILIQSFADENGKEMGLTSLKLGDRLYSTQKMLEKAMQTRVVYTPTGMKTTEIGSDRSRSASK
jgi:methionyl-tRNA formyltransferase